MRKLLLAAMVAMLLGGCGGGSSDPSSSVTAIPGATQEGGLTWAPENSSTYTWGQATTYCGSLSLGGVTGWRLPTQPELTAYAQSGMGANGGGIWSSTAAPTPTYYYWVSLNGNTGTPAALPDTNYLNVLCAH